MCAWGYGVPYKEVGIRTVVVHLHLLLICVYTLDTHHTTHTRIHCTPHTTHTYTHTTHHTYHTHTTHTIHTPHIPYTHHTHTPHTHHIPCAHTTQLQGEQLRSQIYDHLGVMNLLSGGASAPTDHPRAKHPPTMKGGVALSTEMPSVTFSMPRSTSQVPVPVSTGQVPMPRSTSQVPMPVSTSQVPKPFSTNQEPLLPTLKHTYT